MNRLNWLFTLTSIDVISVIIERLSYTTKILLPPFNFLRLHEVIQMSILILISIIIPIFLLKEVTKNFDRLKTSVGTLLLVIFITGIYFYATGNGVHELASFQFNTYCDAKHPIGNSFDNVCNGLYINDYFFGNGIFYIGAILMNTSLLIFEINSPFKKFNRKQLIILFINALFYSIALLGAVAFDPVIVGHTYLVIMTLISGYLLLKARKTITQHPLTLYTFTAYLLGSIAAIAIRLN